MFSRRKRLARSYGRVKERSDFERRTGGKEMGGLGEARKNLEITGNKWRASLVSSIAFP